MEKFILVTMDYRPVVCYMNSVPFCHLMPDTAARDAAFQEICIDF